MGSFSFPRHFHDTCFHGPSALSCMRQNLGFHIIISHLISHILKMEQSAFHNVSIAVSSQKKAGKGTPKKSKSPEKGSPSPTKKGSRSVMMILVNI